MLELVNLPIDSRDRSRWLLPACIALALAYHLPPLLARAGVPPGVANFALLAFYPLAALLAWRGGMSFAQAYGLRWQPRWWAWLLALFALAIVAKALAVAIGAAAGVYASHGAAPAPPTLPAYGALAVMTFVPSLAEDILARGLWIHSPLARSGIAFVLGTAGIYTLNHVWRLSLGPAEWLMLFAFGIAHALAFWRTGTLWAAVGLHWGWNFAGQALDAVWQVDVVDATAAKMLSAATHLALVLVVWLATDTRGKSTAARDAASSAARRLQD